MQKSSKRLRIPSVSVIVANMQKRWRHLFGPKSPHKSFVVTRRRDAVQPLLLPGNLHFTREVFRTIRTYRKPFLGMLVLYIVLYGILVGMGSQEAYAGLSDLLKESTDGIFQGAADALWQSSILFVTIASSGLSGAATAAQQIFASLLFIMMWLATVWMLRQGFSGKPVLLRDGLYRSGAPLFAMIVITLIMVVQLVPLGVAFIGYSAAVSTGLLASGVEAMLFWIAAGLLAVLSLYWLVSSFFALIIITIPGTYPLWALQTASRMVAGRRVRLLLRVAWLGLTVILTWGAVLIPTILIDAGVKQLLPAAQGVPIVPFALLVLSAWTLLWSCVYIYLLYRKVVDNEQ